MSYADYGHNVRTLRLRLRQRLTQAQLGKLAGCTHSTICLHEHNANGPGLRLAVRIAQALGVTLDTLVGPRIAPRITPRLSDFI